MRSNRLSRLIVSIVFIVAGWTTAHAAPDGPSVISPKYETRIERHVMIPMRDGTKLSADMVRPDAEGRFPVVFHYDPYRRSGLGWDIYLAKRGFVSLKLDARGTGGSEGINTDEYMPIEQQDGYDAVEWLAQQPWSNGNVGMMGASYSGFTSLQVATHRPPHLKAIVPIYATDDRYTDDCHYTPGGNMRMYYDVGTYGGMMVGLNALPPYPEMDRLNWTEMWKLRLEKNEPYILQWMKHQVDSPYWRSGSLRPDYDRVQCPVFLIAGWHDGYASSMLRTYANLKAPKKLLAGPWCHTLPDSSMPGPRIEYMSEVSRFFAHWLRGEDTGIMQEPPLTFYMQEFAKPERTMDTIPGHWRNDANFPVPGTKELTFYLAEDGKLIPQPNEKVNRDYDEYNYLATVGLANGYWSAGGIPFYLADDQRADEAYSMTFTTSPFERETHLLGWPKVVLHASSSAQVATFVTKLSDVAPDGTSALIADGSLNGTRRQSLTNPSPMKPGEIYELSVPMWPAAWVLKPGHRLRMAVSSSDFPNLWPTPEAARNRIYRSGRYPSRVILPVVPPSTLKAPQFLPASPLAQRSNPTQQVTYDQITGMATVIVSSPRSEFRCSASSRDPSQASIVGTHKHTVTVGNEVVEVNTESSIQATKTAFRIFINLNVTKNGKPFFQKAWTVTEPRRLL